MKALLPRDTVVVTKLDRLVRSSRDLHNILHELDGLSVASSSLGESWCDTTTDVGRLMLTIMGGIAEFERESDPQPHRCRDRARQAARARSLGAPSGSMMARSGLLPTVTARGRQSRSLAEEYGVGVGTIWRALQPETQEAA
jgi:DNA invertase Pin-like site-specific DNA recombinase